MPNGDDNGDNGGGGFGTGDPLYNAIGALIILLLAVQLFQNLPDMLSNMFGGLTSSIFGYGGWITIYNWLYALSVSFSLACIGGSIYAGMQLSRVRVAQRKELEEMTRAAISGEDTENERWQQILSYAASDDHELWRLAIIEADVMLDEMMETMGYPQDNLGDKLRSVEKSDFYTIEQAWEAHKLRNTIAHEGSSYNLTRRELEKAINNYREVFEEFSYI